MRGRMDMGHWDGASQKQVCAFILISMLSPHMRQELLKWRFRFAGNEAMFQTDYIGKASEGWAEKISPWETVTYEHEENDTSVSYHFDDAADGYDARNITIEREQGGKKKEFTMELYGQPQYGWIVMTDDGHPYLYTEIQSENDWRTMEVFDLKGEEICHVGTSNDSPHGALLNDPDGFYPYPAAVDALGNHMTLTRKFHVGESGMPVAENDVYTKVNVCDSKEDERRWYPRGSFR